MMMFKDIAQQARFAAMQPGQITQHIREQEADLQAFERAVRAADRARYWRACKAQVIAGTRPNTGMRAGDYEALARKNERIVRELALQSEIRLQRRAQAAESDRAMVNIMLGVAS